MVIFHKIIRENRCFKGKKNNNDHFFNDNVNFFFNVHLGPFIVLDDSGVGFTMGFNDVRKKCREHFH